MTELQMGLIGLGATAVVGVYGYNKWQEYRHRKVAEQVLKPHHEDVLLGDGPKPAAPVFAAPPPVDRSEPEIRIEEALPTPGSERIEPMLLETEAVPQPEPLGESPVDASAFAEAGDGELEPAAAVEESVSAPAQPEPEGLSEELPPVEVPPALLDPRLEFVVAMELVDPVSARQILHSQREVLQRVAKPIHWLGFNERSREWERLTAESPSPVRRLRVGLQLVNRLGPVSDADLAVFVGAMQALADELMAVADMPSTRVRDAAAEIDRFCAEVDLEIGVNLVSKGTPFSGTKIRALAEAAGMVLGVDGLFTRYDDEGRAQFCLQNFESTQFSAESIRSLSTHGLTFLLDVPRVDHGERVFMQMSELAKRFAETLNGMLVDDNRHPLSDAQLDHIKREFVGKPQAAMLAYRLPAGSAQALRLFS